MIIDFHAHIGRIVTERKELLDASQLISRMEEWGIEKACVLPLSETPEGEYLEADTEDVIRECSHFPERLIPFCLLDPRFGLNHPQMDFSPWLKEYVKRGCRGLGELLPKMDIDDPRCLNLFRQAGQMNLPVVIDLHSRPVSYGLNDAPGLPGLEKVLRLCPETIIIGHGPTFWAEISKDVSLEERQGYPKGPIKKGGAVIRLMKKYPNLWADLSAGSGYNALTRDSSFGLEFLETFQNKLLFGTDYCVRSHTEKQVKIVSFFHQLREKKLISFKAWEKIAFKNAIRLLRL